MRNRWNKPDEWNRLIAEGVGSALQANGWRITKRVESNLVWWVERVWMIESIWSPVGIGAQLSFLREPEGLDVETLAVDLEEPGDRLEAGKIIRVGIGDREEAFREFTAALASWRDESAKRHN